MKNFITISLILLFIFSIAILDANDKVAPIINVKILNSPEPGYIFVGTTQSDIGIMDNYGKCIDSSALRLLAEGFDLKVQKNGLLTFFSPGHNCFYGLNNKYQIIDSFSVPIGEVTDFHELTVNSDGSYFILGSETRTVNMSKLVQNGKENAEVVGFNIYEYSSNKSQVWKWSTWGNFEITDATSDIDLTQDYIKYCHVNSIDKDIIDGNIIISSRHLDEVTKINHSTGKIIWRMGGKNCKNNQFEFIKDTLEGYWGFSHQHDARRLSNGNLLLLDNGNMRASPQFTRAVEYRIDETNKKATKVWEFMPNEPFYAEFMGSVQRLTNGGTLISMADRIYEIDKANNLTFFGMLGNLDYTYRAYKSVYNSAATNKSLTKSGTYDYNSNGNQTDVTLVLTSINKSGRLSVEKHNYKPSNSVFDEYLPAKILYYRWVLSGEVTNPTGKIRISTQNLTGFTIADTFSIYFRNKETLGSFAKLTTSYNSIGKYLEAPISKIGEYILANNKALPSIAPFLKSPSNESLYKGDSPLKWNSTAGADKYIVQISKISDFSEITLDTIVNTVTYNFTNFDNGTKYFWRVKAYNQEFDYSSPWSEIWTFRTSISIPILFEPKNNSIRLSYISGKIKWNIVVNASNYSLEVSTDSSFTNLNEKVIALSNLIDTTYFYQTLNPYTNYYWRVAAINGDGFTNWSKIYKFQSAVTIPKLISPENKTFGIDVSGILRYEKSIEGDNYQYQLSRYFDFSNIEVNGITSHTQNTNFTKLASYTRYFWRIRAVHEKDTSDWSEIYQFTTQIVIPKLHIPVNYSTNELQNLNLTWENVNGTLNYELMLCETNDFKQSQTFSTLINYKALSNLKPLQDYFWKVRAFYNGGNSNWSEIWKFNTGPAPTLNTPILLLPNNLTIDLAKNVLLNWMKVLEANNYRIQVSNNVNFDGLEKDSITNNNECLIYNLENETTYFWKIQAQGNNTLSNWSEIRKFTIGGKTIPSFPILLTPKNLEIIKDSLVTFIWQSVDNAIEYGIIYAEDKSLTVNVNEVVAKDTNYKVLLENNKTYYWKMYSRTLKVQSLDSPINSFSINSNFSSIENREIDGLHIYPNPVSSYLNLDLSQVSNKAKINICSTLGNVLKEIDLTNLNKTNFTINCEFLCSGVYFIEIIEPSKKSVLHFIKD